MQEQLQSLLAEQLKDVHSPDPISGWPFAIGWWVLIALGIIVIVTTIMLMLRRWRKTRYRAAALQELNRSYEQWLQDQQTAAYLQTANAILKRSALHFNQTPGLAKQSGATWINTLNHYLKKALSDDSQQALINGCYQAQPTVDISTVHPEYCRWLKTHRTTPIDMTGDQHA